MSRSSFISFGLCAVGSVAFFGWLFANAPLKQPVSVKTAGVEASRSVAKKPGPVVFAVPRSKATALNDVPVNIVIGPVTATKPVNSGALDRRPADLVVTSSGLRMRAEPSSRSSTLANYSKGARFSLIRDENGWALVQSLDDGQKGWMFKKFMGKAS